MDMLKHLQSTTSDVILEKDPSLMENKNYSNMCKYMRVFQEAGTFTGLGREELTKIPKEILLTCASDEIAILWDRLPSRLQKDEEIIKYQFCTDHHGANSTSQSDVNDGPTPRRLLCCYCNIKDITILAGNSRGTETNQIFEQPNYETKKCCQLQ